MMGEIGVESREDGDAVWDGAEGAEQVNRSLETASGEPRASEKQVADTRAGEVESARGSHALDHLQVEAVQVRAYKFPFG